MKFSYETLSQSCFPNSRVKKNLIQIVIQTSNIDYVSFIGIVIEKVFSTVITEEYCSYTRLIFF